MNTYSENKQISIITEHEERIAVWVERVAKLETFLAQCKGYDTSTLDEVKMQRMTNKISETEAQIAEFKGIIKSLEDEVTEVKQFGWKDAGYDCGPINRNGH